MNALTNNHSMKLHSGSRLWQRVWQTLLALGIVFGLFLSPLARTPFAIQRALAASHTSTLQPFTQVNDGAFGLGGGADDTYSDEKSFEVLIFNNQLYLGMEADNSMGARLWRTKPISLIAPSQVPTDEETADSNEDTSSTPDQLQWEEVIADDNGYPFGVPDLVQNDTISSLAEFNGYLYASTANGGSSLLGTRIFRSPSGDPGSWEDAISAYGAGFGDTNNTNFKDMQVFDGWLCGGTQNRITGAQVWCTNDGTTWIQKNYSGFGKSLNNNKNVEVWSGYVYNNALYFGVQNLGVGRDDSTDDVAKLYRTTSLSGTPAWKEVYSGASGSSVVNILGDLNGYLYIAVMKSAGIVILRSPTGNACSWSQAGKVGMNSSPNNTGTVVDGAVVHDGVLYVAVSNTVTGFELWQTTGVVQRGRSAYVDWTQIGGSGLGDANNYSAELIVFDGNFYAWTTNYATGQQVLQSQFGD